MYSIFDKKRIDVGWKTSYLLNLLLGSALLMIISKSSTRWHMHASAAITQSPFTSHLYFRQNRVEKTYKKFNSVKWCILVYHYVMAFLSFIPEFTLADTKNILSTLVLSKTTSPVELIVKSLGYIASSRQQFPGHFLEI